MIGVREKMLKFGKKQVLKKIILFTIRVKPGFPKPDQETPNYGVNFQTFQSVIFIGTCPLSFKSQIKIMDQNDRKLMLQ